MIAGNLSIFIVFETSIAKLCFGKVVSLHRLAANLNKSGSVLKPVISKRVHSE